MDVLAAPPGSYEIDAEVDWSDVIEESNEGNNVSNRIGFTR